jgi:hypothetical protein
MHWWINLSKALRIQGPTVSPKMSRIRGPEIAVTGVVSWGTKRIDFDNSFLTIYKVLCPFFFLTKVMLFLITPE